MGFTHGVELGFSYYYGLQKPGKPVYIVKVVQGGTSLGGDWVQGGVLRNKLIEYINKAKAEVQNPKFSFYWNQWESDSPNNSFSDDYEANYQEFISDVLNQTGINFDKHIIQKANPSSSFAINYPANYQTILTAQTNNAAFYNAVLLSSDALPLFDNVHYGSEELNEIGNNLNGIINP